MKKNPRPRRLNTFCHIPEFIASDLHMDYATCLKFEKGQGTLGSVDMYVWENIHEFTCYVLSLSQNFYMETNRGLPVSTSKGSMTGEAYLKILFSYLLSVLYNHLERMEELMRTKKELIGTAEGMGLRKYIHVYLTIKEGLNNEKCKFSWKEESKMLQVWFEAFSEKVIKELN